MAKEILKNNLDKIVGGTYTKLRFIKVMEFRQRNIYKRNKLKCDSFETTLKAPLKMLISAFENSFFFANFEYPLNVRSLVKATIQNKTRDTQWDVPLHLVFEERDCISNALTDDED